MICGGTDATITPLGVGGSNAMRALPTRNDAPQQASRPFDKNRDAKIYAELTGYAANADAHHITSPAPEGEGAQRCMRLALKDAKLQPSDIGYINAHGTSTEINDATETLAIKKVFGDHARKLMISSTKSMTGHMLGATGGV